MNCLFWHFAGPLEVDDISSQFHLCICDLLLSCMSAHPACCTLDAPCMSDLLCKPCWCGLVSLRHSEWKVNVCVSLSCDPVYIDVSLKVALPAASLCSAATVLQYPVALKTLHLFRIMFRIGKWSRPRLQRDGRLLHVFIEKFSKWKAEP